MGIGMTVKIKPLTVNRCWQGRRFKTKEYKTYEEELFWQLKDLQIPEPPYFLKIEVGLSSKNADVDNVLKPLLDILQKRYEFNDKSIYQLFIEKVDVKKGEEYLTFSIQRIGQT